MDAASRFRYSWEMLNPVEKKTAIYVLRGLSNQEIAKESQLKMKTVEGCVHFILKKFSVSTRTKFMAFYYRESGLLIDELTFELSEK